MVETTRRDVAGEGFELFDVSETFVDDVEPGEPFAFVVAGPDRGVAQPQAADLAVLAPPVEGFLYRLVEVGWELEFGLGDTIADQGKALVGHCTEEIVEGLGEGFDALVDQRAGDAGEIEAEALGFGQGVFGAVDIFGQRGAHGAVVAKGVHGGGRHGIDGFVADQLFDVENVGVGFVLGAGAGPEEALRVCALFLEGLPAGRGHHLEIMLVGQLGVGDGDLTADCLQGGSLRIVGGHALVDGAVDLAVDAADEEARDRGDAGDVLALAGAVF